MGQHWGIWWPFPACIPLGSFYFSQSGWTHIFPPYIPFPMSLLDHISGSSWSTPQTALLLNYFAQSIWNPNPPGFFQCHLYMCLYFLGLYYPNVTALWGAIGNSHHCSLLLIISNPTNLILLSTFLTSNPFYSPSYLLIIKANLPPFPFCLPIIKVETLNT